MGWRSAALALSALRGCGAFDYALPDSPRAPDVVESSVTSSSVELRWPPVEDELALAVDAYAVEAVSLQGRARGWIKLRDDVGLTGNRRRETQAVHVRCDRGNTVAEGYFQLYLAYGGVEPLDTDARAVTARIPFDASAADLKAALEALENVGGVNVVRCDAPGAGGILGGCAGGLGAFSWTVEFVEGEAELNARTQKRQLVVGKAEDRNVPLLGVFKETISLNAKWSGPGGSVSVWRTGHEGLVLETLGCSTRAWPDALGAPPLTSLGGAALCRYNVSSGLDDAGGLYAFRLRAHSASGWSAPGAPSKYVRLRAARPPPTPHAPVPARAGAVPLAEGAVSFYVSTPTVQALSTAAGAAPAAEFKVQYRDVRSAVWVDFGLVGVDESGWATATISGLDGGAKVEVRAAAVNAAGTSRYSASSNAAVAAVETLPAVPTAPMSSKATVSSITVSWRSGESNATLPTADYAVSMQAWRGSGWRKPHAWIDDVVGVVLPISTTELKKASQVQALVLVSKISSAGNSASSFEAAAMAIVESDVGALEAATFYRFRVRAGAAGKYSDWSLASEWHSTLPAQQADLSSSPVFKPSLAVFDSASSWRCAHVSEPDYVDGAGDGGDQGESGLGGLAVLVAYSDVGLNQARATFYFDDEDVGAKLFTVPKRAGRGAQRLVVKLWGAGGGGAGAGRGEDNSTSLATASKTDSLTYDRHYGRGGGGGFVQATLAVQPGDVLKIIVGGGGGGSRHGAGGGGGFNGGGAGGDGEWGGGGGGGATELWHGDTLLMLAAGGGGAGASDYCCAHGGGGGGLRGGNGNAPGFATPVETAQGRHEYSPESSDALDARDLGGPHARHRHLDLGRAPGADYSKLAAGGSGATQIDAGLGGESGSYAVAQYGDGSSFEARADGSSDGGLRGYAAALKGGEQKGGRGAAGKEAGGGGGSGWRGGGGGGAGVDGGGGGGGSGLVFGVALQDASDASGALFSEVAQQPWAPDAPRCLGASHSALKVAWASTSSLRADGVFYAERYHVEMARAAASLNFITVAVSPATDAGVTISNLDAAMHYLFRVRAANHTATSRPSPPVSCSTSDAPRDRWSKLAERSFLAADGGYGRASPVLERPHSSEGAQSGNAGRQRHKMANAGGGRLSDPPTADRPARPSPRQGHSLTRLSKTGVVDVEGLKLRHSEVGSLFLFGGHGDGYECDGAVGASFRLGSPAAGRNVDRCLQGSGASDELWRLDARYSTWSLVEPLNGLKPPPRSRHVAAALNGKVYVWGGAAEPANAATANAATVYMNDLWVLDVGHDALYTFRCNFEDFPRWDFVPEHRGDVRSPFYGGVSVGTAPEKGQDDEAYWRKRRRLDASEEFVSNVPPADTVSFTTQVQVADGWCIQDVDVRIAVTHPCPATLTLTLLGPGTSAGDRNFGAPVAPSLAVPLIVADDAPCVPDLKDATFDDEADKDVASARWPPYDGRFRPLGRLSQFYGTCPGKANWTLKVRDDGYDEFAHAEVSLFEVIVRAERCEPEYTWTNLTHAPLHDTSNPPPPRSEATGVSAGDSLFIYGGRNEDTLPEPMLYRFDSSKGTWKRLKPAAADSDAYYSVGRCAAITPWGVYAFGGFGAGSSNAPGLLDPRVWRFDLWSKRWTVDTNVSPTHPGNVEPRLSRIDGAASTARSLDHVLASVAPRARLHASLEYVEAGIVDFVGAALSGTTPFQSPPALLLYGGQDWTQDLDDVWVLSLGNASLLPPKSDALCRFHFRGATEARWLKGCGAGEAEECALHDVLLRAFCLGQFQSLNSLPF
ncbi:hypothetical protein M885DRAFT_520609 [Pelagophyceae sp. CCMP2097]|nr:hypothetical protein M885DRAFT_520609 [Pelagophyceae sp. CCMP2097]